MASALSISAELTYLRVRGILSYFMEAADRYQVPLTILLGVASRESRMGLALDTDGTGDHGYGHGIMQVDKRHHPNFTTHHSPIHHPANINYGSQFLAKLLSRFNGRYRPAIAAYNAGESRVKKAILAGLDPDQVTTGGDYSSDVLRRVKIIESVMGLTKASSAAAYLIPGFIGLLTYNIFKTSSP